MESIAVIFMLLSGGAIALFVMAAMSLAHHERPREEGSAVPERSRIAGSLLFHVLVADGTRGEDALREMRRTAGIALTPSTAIDVASWGERYAQMTTIAERERLLESAVVILSARGRTVPLLQYVALLDLSFALGFRTDALAKLRERHRFEYVDHAKAARPREADRSSRATFYVREEARESDLLARLELEGHPTRQEIIAAYRRLAGRHHPDRFHGARAEELEEAAARFIEITRAYEALLALRSE